MIYISFKTSFAIFPEIIFLLINFTSLPKYAGVIGVFIISILFSLSNENNSEVIQFTTIFEDFFKLLSDLITSSK